MPVALLLLLQCLQPLIWRLLLLLLLLLASLQLPVWLQLLLVAVQMLL
jgi:hypothetical protein